MTRFGWLFSRERDALDAPSLHAGCLDHDLQTCSLRMRREPGARRGKHAAHLLRVDHLQGMPEVGAAFLLDLDHEQTASSTQDEVELVTGRAGVGLEQAITAKPVVTKGAALAAIHAAS